MQLPSAALHPLCWVRRRRSLLAIQRQNSTGKARHAHLFWNCFALVNLFSISLLAASRLSFSVFYRDKDSSKSLDLVATDPNDWRIWTQGLVELSEQSQRMPDQYFSLMQRMSVPIFLKRGRRTSRQLLDAARIPFDPALDKRLFCPLPFSKFTFFVLFRSGVHVLMHILFRRSVFKTNTSEHSAECKEPFGEVTRTGEATSCIASLHCSPLSI